MAHNIMHRNGIDCMFAVGETGERDTVWHRLGARVDNAVSWPEAMRLAGLEWQVEKRQLFAALPDGTERSVYTPIDAYGVFRTDDNNFLGAVGSKYAPIQNKDAFLFVDTLLEATLGSHYDSAGALGNGERIWCAAKVPFDFEPVAGDVHTTYLMFTTSHDGQASAMCKLTTVRVVCQNTLTAAISDGGAMVRIRHTASAGERLARAADLMRGVGSDVQALNVKLARLAEVAASEELIAKVMDRLFPRTAIEIAAGSVGSARRQNIVADIARLYAHNDGGRIAGISGTAYNLLNAITEYADHFRSVRGGNGDAEQLASCRAESGVFGSGEQLKSEALEALVALS